MKDNPYIRIFESLDFEQIKDHPNILIAASFWDKERYQAAQTCYRYLRNIDDMIDCHKSMHPSMAENDRKQLLEKVHIWIDSIKDISARKRWQPELTHIMQKFHLPLWPLEDFAKAMIYDINHNGFFSINDFIEYSQGASVAPASIFVHLSGLRSAGSNYQPPLFDVKAASTPCAMFSYLVHIIRDFRTDQENNLNYFAHDILHRNRLDPLKIKAIAKGEMITPDFRNMIKEYYLLADAYRRRTKQVIEEISDLVEPRYLLSLHIIFNLYLMVFERIDYANGDFHSGELHPSSEEIRQRVLETIHNFRI